jgi:hypothetical protein
MPGARWVTAVVAVLLLDAEAFAVALDARGQVANVTPGRAITIRG